MSGGKGREEMKSPRVPPLTFPIVCECSTIMRSTGSFLHMGGDVGCPRTVTWFIRTPQPEKEEVKKKTSRREGTMRKKQKEKRRRKEKKRTKRLC
jgi:hypothetical protein